MFVGNSHSNEDRFVCSGYDNGDIKVFDLRNLSLFWEKNLKNGVRKSYLIINIINININIRCTS